MDLMDAIKGRRSIRKYKTDPVPEEVAIDLEFKMGNKANLKKFFTYQTNLLK